MPYAILIGAFLTVVLLVIGIYYVFFSSRANVLSRIEKATMEEVHYEPMLEKEKKDTRRQLMELISKLGQLILNNKYESKKRKKLAQAAVLMKPEEFLGISFICGLLLTGFIFILSKSVVALAFFPIGFIIPDRIIGIKKSKRMIKINNQLPEALNIISNGLRAGYSFTQAMAVVTVDMQGPISDEFNKVLRDNSYGKPLEEALMDMNERTDDEDLDMFITALIIQRQVGGNLADILDTISHTIRERVRIKGDIKTLTAQGRISGIIVSVLPVGLAFALSVISPGYLDVLFTTTIGNILIFVGVILQIIGIITLLKLVDVKV